MIPDHKKRGKTARFATTCFISTVLISSVLTFGLETAASATGSTISEAATFPNFNEAPGLQTLAINPQNAGDLVVFESQIHSTSIIVTGVSAPGTGTWHLAERFVDLLNNVITEEIWWAVATSAGSSTISVSYSGSVASISPELVADSFTTAEPSTWSLVANNGTSAMATTAITLPNLTSNSDANQVYWGYVESTQTAASGNTLGFAYSPVNTGNLLVSNDLLGTNTSFAPTATDSPTGNNTSSAVIFAAVPTVDFNGNGSTSGSMSPENANSSTALTTNTFTKTGYTFSGWNTAPDGSGTTYADDANYSFTTGANLYAQWTADYYNVTFDGNGSTGGSMSVENANTSTALTTNTFTKTGSTFDGWNTAADGSGTTYADDAVYPFTSATTLYAQWAGVYYNVSFDGNGATGGSMSPENANTSTALATNTFTKTGYTFSGWNTARDGSGTGYAAGAFYPFTSATTLYAQWTADYYNVTFDGNGATSGSMNPENANTSTALTTNTFTKTGYTFSGWNTAANGSGTSYAGGANYPFTAATTFYAQWTATSYSVTFVGNGATSGTMSPENANTSTALTTNTFTKTGYTFSGWNTAANGSGTSYAGGANYPFTAATILYAQWTATSYKATSYKVTFAANGATRGQMSPETHSAPAALNNNVYTRTGYTFSGWNTTAKGSGTKYANRARYAFKAGVTLYAQWTATSYKATSYKVTFAANGATRGKMSAETHSAPAALNNNVYTRTGYTFSGWNTTAKGSGTKYANRARYAFKAGVTLYAQWTVVVPVPHVSSVLGSVVVGESRLVTIDGTGFSSRSHVTSNEPGSAVRLIYASATRLSLLVTVRVGSRLGKYTFTITAASRKTWTINYVTT
jgi:uncharacterized repeat protein (TIGR02543 family)